MTSISPQAGRCTAARVPAVTTATTRASQRSSCSSGARRRGTGGRAGANGTSLMLSAISVITEILLQKILPSSPQANQLPDPIAEPHELHYGRGRHPADLLVPVA